MSEKFEKKVKLMREKHFPMTLDNGVTCRLLDHGEFRKYLRKHFKKVFPPIKFGERFSFSSLSKKRQESVRCIYEHRISIHHDYCGFFSKTDEFLGWSSGEVEDEQTYYMRNSGILPVHQGKGIYSSFLPRFTQYLEDLGFERVASYHKGDNPKVFIPKLREGFMIVGMESIEHWGVLVRMVKLLKRDRQKFFIKKFF